MENKYNYDHKHKPDADMSYSIQVPLEFHELL